MFTVQELSEFGFGLLQFHKLRQVIFVQRVGLAQVSVQIELVEPDIFGGRAFLEEQHHRLDARAGKRAAGQIQHRVQVTALQQFAPQADRRVVGI